VSPQESYSEFWTYSRGVLGAALKSMRGIISGYIIGCSVYALAYYMWSHGWFGFQGSLLPVPIVAAAMGLAVIGLWPKFTRKKDQ
jgi:hypothetical protein